MSNVLTWNSKFTDDKYLASTARTFVPIYNFCHEGPELKPWACTGKWEPSGSENLLNFEFRGWIERILYAEKRKDIFGTNQHRLFSLSSLTLYFFNTVFPEITIPSSIRHMHSELLISPPFSGLIFVQNILCYWKRRKRLS